MTTRIALLRAVNVGGTGKVLMSDLRAFFDELGLPDATTLLQGGNVVFESAAAPQDLEARLERLAAKGRQAYFVYPDGIGQSGLTSAVIERHLRTRGTARNWNSVRKLAVLAGVAVGAV